MILNWFIICIANCYCFKLSPVLTIILTHFHVLKCLYIDLLLIPFSISLKGISKYLSITLMVELWVTFSEGKGDLSKSYDTETSEYDSYLLAPKFYTTPVVPLSLSYEILCSSEP